MISRDFIQQLLARDAAHRLGCRSNGAEGVRANAFFASIHWRRLERKQLPPPSIPKLSGPMDTSAFVVLKKPPHLGHEQVSSLNLEVQDAFKDW